MNNVYYIMQSIFNIYECFVIFPDSVQISLRGRMIGTQGRMMRVSYFGQVIQDIGS